MMDMKKMNIGVVGLVTALVIPLAPAATAQEPSLDVVQSNGLKDRQFQACASGDAETPEALPVGEALGPGITEPLDNELRTSLIDNGFTVPASAVGVRHLDSGESVFVNSGGDNLGTLSGESAGTLEVAQPAGVIPAEAKRIIGACLGFSWATGPAAEAIFREVTSVKKAVKFIIRRIGLGAAIGCVGGIIWEYI